MQPLSISLQSRRNVERQLKLKRTVLEYNDSIRGEPTRMRRRHGCCLRRVVRRYNFLFSMRGWPLPPTAGYN